MNSFTSNSDFKYVIKIFLITGFLLFGYGLATRSINFNPFTSQSQFQENQYKAENFIQRVSHVDPSEYSILVGSSLSAKLKEEYFQGKIFNFSLGGGSAQTGLEFILKTKSHFKRVLVDATLLRDMDEEMVSVFKNRVELWRINHLPFTNIDHQPVSLLSNFIKSKTGASVESAYDQKQFEQWLDFNQGRYGVLTNTDKENFDRMLGQLKPQVDELERMGTQIVFVEMPMDPRMAAFSAIQYYKKSVRAAFAQNTKIHWVEPSKNYETLDGLHLTTESAKAFAKELDD